MEISVDRTRQRPLYRQIADQIRQLILSGAIGEGFRLPPERRLAATLGVNRTTVLAAYRELKGDGLVDSHVGRGTAVLGAPAGPARPGTPDRPVTWPGLFTQTPGPGRDRLLSDLLALTERPDVISLSIGLPAPELLPAAQLAATFAGLAERVGAAPLLHCPTEGHSPLRAAIADWLVSRGVECDPAEVLVLSGSQQGLDLLAQVFLEPGDEVVVEEPTYIGALAVLRAAGVRLVPVPTDAEGLRTDVLEGVLDRHRPKLIYTLPTFQNPTGLVMSPARRRQLLELAGRHGVPIVEDDPYSELRYEGDPVPSLRALDGGRSVLYLSTFSKVLAPGLRIGFLVAPREVVRRFAAVKQRADLHAPSLGQWLIEGFLREGRLTAHLERLRMEYRRRRDALAEALAAEAGDLLEWDLPRGGFYLWCRLRRPVVPARLVAAAAEAQVAYLPGETCAVHRPEIGALRLNFSYNPPQRLAEGVRRLVRALAIAAADPGVTTTVTPTVV